MNLLEKFQKVNECESVIALENAIKSFANENGMIQGRVREFNAENMASCVRGVVMNELPANRLTRELGIRQQALYLREYSKM